MGFLDETGLARFLDNLQSWVADSAVAASAVKASQDASGNVITSTYATKAEVSAKADDSAVVHSSGNEDIAGDKSFSGTVYAHLLVNQASSDELGLRAAASASNGATISLYSKNHSTKASVFRAVPRNGGTYTVLEAWPDGTFTWGGQAIQTASDERLKTPLSSVPDEVLDAWGAVQWGQFQFLEAVERKGASARLHLGLIAQRVKAVFEARGLDACAYGILCYDKDEDMWMVRYEEALAMEAACQRRRADRLEARIAALEARLDG